MSEVPTAVSEATNAVVKLIEGSTRSHKAVDTLTAGDIVFYSTNSGVIQATGDQVAGVIEGVLLYDAVSGERAVVGRGLMRCRWDGTGTVGRGTGLAVSTTRSGWFKPIGAVTSGTLIIGHSFAVLAAANSGLLNDVEIF